MNRFRKLLVMIFLLTPWWMSSVAFAQQVEERIVINFKGDKLPADLEAQIQAAGGVLVNTLPQVGIAVAVSADPNFTSVIATGADVISVGAMPFYVLPAMGGEAIEEGPTDADVHYDYGNGILWGINRVHAPDAWKVKCHPDRKGCTGSHQTVVAVIDTGIAWNHPDLAPNVIDKKCYRYVKEEGETPAHVDDSCDPYPAAGEICSPLPFPPPGRVPCLEFNHGTHVAGTIAAAFGGGGYVGVGPNLALVSYKVSQVDPDLGKLVAYPDIVWKAMIDAADKGYEVINFSWGWMYPDGFGGPGSNNMAAYVQAHKQNAKYVNKQGSVIVASAGNVNEGGLNVNGTTIVLPADLPQVIGVSATGIRPEPKYPWPGSYDVLPFYSNYGASGVSLAAPGGDCGKDWCDPSSKDSSEAPYRIASTAVELANPACRTAKPPTCPPALLAWGGTSMATAHVSGVIGLVRDANPNLTPNQVEALIKTTADDLGDHQSFGHGMVNAYEAVMKAVR